MEVRSPLPVEWSLGEGYTGIIWCCMYGGLGVSRVKWGLNVGYIVWLAGLYRG